MKGSTIAVILLAAGAIAAGAYVITRKQEQPVVVQAPAYEEPPAHMTGVDYSAPPPDEPDPEEMLLQFGTSFLSGLATSAGKSAGSAFSDGSMDFSFFG